ERDHGASAGAVIGRAVSGEADQDPRWNCARRAPPGAFRPLAARKSTRTLRPLSQSLLRRCLVNLRVCCVRVGIMRIAVMIGPLGRAAFLVALAGGVAGCASDTKRFDEGLVGQYGQNQPYNWNQLYSQNQAAPPAPAARVDTAQLPEPPAARPAQV